MDFPLTHQKIKAYAEDRAVSTICEVREEIKKHIQLGPCQILSDLKKDMDKAIRTKTGETVFRVYLGNLSAFTARYSWQLIQETLVDDYLNPLIKDCFPIATYEIVDGAFVRLVFNCPEISDQTSSPSQ